MERLSTYDIHSKAFKICFRGYDVVEVNEFMDLVIEHYDRLCTENVVLKGQMDPSEINLENKIKPYLSSKEFLKKGFKKSFRGYDRNEVDNYLKLVFKSYDDVSKENQSLKISKNIF